MSFSRGKGDSFVRGAKLAFLLARGATITRPLICQELGLSPGQASRDFAQLEQALPTKLVRLASKKDAGRQYTIYGLRLRRE